LTHVVLDVRRQSSLRLVRPDVPAARQPVIS
jgi:hypothetical protein